MQVGGRWFIPVLGYLIKKRGKKRKKRGKREKEKRKEEWMIIRSTK